LERRLGGGRRDKGQAMESLGTEARGGTAWNGRREGNGYSVYYNKKLG